jgi:hypothetical protein
MISPDKVPGGRFNDVGMRLKNWGTVAYVSELCRKCFTLLNDSRLQFGQIPSLLAGNNHLRHRAFFESREGEPTIRDQFGPLSVIQ